MQAEEMGMLLASIVPISPYPATIAESGESLCSIARREFGEESLWIVIAALNDRSGVADCRAGDILILPGRRA